MNSLSERSVLQGRLISVNGKMMQLDSFLNSLDKSIGCLVGLAVGDAIGTTVEFSQKGSFTPVKTMVGGGVFGLPVGAWTDDTSMALCLASSLIDRGEFDPKDQLSQYVKWWKSGYMSSTGRCFDIGTTTVYALTRFLESGQTIADTTDFKYCGNGSIMRLAPIPIWTSNKTVEYCIELSAKSSETTHASDVCLDSCRFLGFILHSLINGKTAKEAVDYPFELKCDEIKHLINMTPKDSDEGYGSDGYAATTLESAIWAFLTTDNFEDAVLRAVNLGGDADTIGAVCGQIAGAYYGFGNIPKNWIDKLYKADMIKDMAIKLFVEGING